MKDEELRDLIGRDAGERELELIETIADLVTRRVRREVPESSLDLRIGDWVLMLHPAGGFKAKLVEAEIVDISERKIFVEFRLSGKRSVYWTQARCVLDRIVDDGGRS